MPLSGPLTLAEFSVFLNRLGPFGLAPRLAVAVSGGADSMALAHLASGWARAHRGDLISFVVDHGLRAESRSEAVLTLERLAAGGISGRLLVLHDLAAGPALAMRAREARFAALIAACEAAGITDLLLGHHAGDQAETLMIRALAGSAEAGFAGIAAQRATNAVRLIRPLLAVPPARLRATLVAAGIEWVEDPSNADPNSVRARLRAGSQGGTEALVKAATGAGAARAASDIKIAEILAERMSFFPEGYAVLTPGPVPAAAFAAVLRAIAGAAYPVSVARIADLAQAPRPATIAGVRLLPAGARGPGWILVRESAMQQPEVPAISGQIWDNRFRLESPDIPGATIGPLGKDAARWKRRLPAAILWTLPAVRVVDCLLAVPHLAFDITPKRQIRLQFHPPNAAGGVPWFLGNQTG